MEVRTATVEPIPTGRTEARMAAAAGIRRHHVITAVTVATTAVREAVITAVLAEVTTVAAPVAAAQVVRTEEGIAKRG
ncbi:MAG: hypothetical protein WBM11_08575 [Terriglobales bacterium]